MDDLKPMSAERSAVAFGLLLVFFPLPVLGYAACIFWNLFHIGWLNGVNSMDRLFLGETLDERIARKIREKQP
jgi:hypothetical protein